MKFTLNEKINVDSLVLRHNILAQACTLAMGREGVLQTEKNLYLVMSLVDNLIEEDLIDMCNQDERNLSTFMVEEVEPYFFELLKEEKYTNLYKEVKELFLQRCKEVWDNQHSIGGIIDSLLTTIALMSPEDKKEALEVTGKIAEQAFEKRTEVMEQKAEETNSKLEQLVQQYQRMEGKIAQKAEEEKNKQEEKEGNSTE